jgi:hypothetical protein
MLGGSLHAADEAMYVAKASGGARLALGPESRAA